MLYETDYKNRLRCCSFTQEFSQTVPIPKQNISDISAFGKALCERISCKLLSPRRIVIKASLGVQFDVEGDTAVKAVAVNEDKETFFRKKTIGFDGKTLLFDSVSRFGDSLSLMQNEKCIGEIICGNIRLQHPQVTLSPGRAEIKTTATVNLLYENENSEGVYSVTTKTLPVNIDFKNDAIEDFKRISVMLIPSGAEFTPELDQYGENRMFKAAFSIKTELYLNEPKAYTVADDLFEKDYDSVPVKSTVVLPQFHSQSDVSFSGEAKIPPMSIKPDAILDASAQSHGITAETAEGGININGSFAASLLYNSAEGIGSADIAIPFERFIPLDLPSTVSSVSAYAYPIETQTVINHDGSITARVVAGARLCIFTQSEESFITEVTKRVRTVRDTDHDVLIYCYPQKGEDLWSIAKLYRADPESIASANPQAFEENGRMVDPTEPILIKI